MMFFRLLLLGLLSFISLPGIAASVQIETSPESGKPWHGLAADGRNTLLIELRVPEAAHQIHLASPSLGRFSETGGTDRAASSPVVLHPDAQGRATVFYHPPPYLFQPADLSPSGFLSASGPSWLATTTLRFSWKNRSIGGVLATGPTFLEIPLQLCRPPVLLIHGFTGSQASLASYASALVERRFDVIARDYFNRDPSDRRGSSVESQAERLAAVIRETRTAWETKGFKVPRVDLIGHSLGGLIARQFLATQPATATVPVRKLIMVGTPNHGITWMERVAARLIAEFQAGKHQRAAEQLFSGSPLFRQLNAGEAAGKHLRPDVQYGLIIGLRSRYEHFDLTGNLFGDLETPADDDGVVTRASAQLNGVQSYISGQVFHTFTPQLQQVFPRDAPLTRSDNIGDRLAKLLLLDIPRPPLAGSELIVRRSQGLVFHRRSIEDPWTIIGSWPSSLGSGWTAIQTRDGRALLGLSIKEQVWASVALPPNSEIEIGYASPQLVQVRIVNGQARFTSMQAKTGRFEIILGDSAKDWKEFQPRARVCNLDTDFTVTAGKEITIQSREGRVAVQGFASGGRRLSRVIASGSALGIDARGTPRTVASVSASWWNDPFFDVSRDDWKEDTTDPQTPAIETAPEAGSASLLLFQGFDEELHSLFEQLQSSLSEVASSGPILTESGWSSDERHHRILSITEHAHSRATTWLQRHPELPLPLQLGVRYFVRRLGVLVDPTFTFDGDPRREAFFYAEFSRGRDDLLTELETFVRPTLAAPLNQEYVDHVVQGLSQTAHLLKAIQENPKGRPDHPGGPKSWKDAWWLLARQVMSASEEADLAARRFEQEGSLIRLKYATKYFKLRLKEIGRSSWEKQLSEEAWHQSFQASTSDLSQTLEELSALLKVLR